jgi:hypothetical protein
VIGVYYAPALIERNNQMTVDLSPIEYKGYRVKPIEIPRKLSNSQNVQGGYAFVVCQGVRAVFGLVVKRYYFVEEDITENDNHELFKLGKEKIFALIDKDEFDEGGYHCYEWAPDNSPSQLKKVDCRSRGWTSAPFDLDYECKD